MPIYVYHCPSCGHDFEELVPSMSAAESMTCPQCGKAGAERRQAAFATKSGSGASGSQTAPCGIPATM
ncbi:MAG TPA: zinc ribbon domain-containing protein [Acidobacteriota bacterium]|nr:zinc ribbon domain-containing protein [Acidobacteriota bacterium]